MEDNNEGKQKMVKKNVGGSKRKCIISDYKKPLWSDLPLELLEMIKKRLFLIDRVNFHGVCKSWSCIKKVPPLEQMPWLLVFDYDYGGNLTCQLVDSKDKKTYMIDTKGIRDKFEMKKSLPLTQVHESKFGWLLASNCYNCGDTHTTILYLYNPFLAKTINFIELPVLSSYISFATFTCNPLDPGEDYTVLALHTNGSDNTLHINMYRSGQSSWNNHVFKCEFSLLKVERWMYSQGIFYYVTGKPVVVGKFDFVQQDWTVFPSLQTSITDKSYLQYYHMVKSDGELFLILESNLHQSWRSWCYFSNHIYRLDLSSMIWEELSSIGDRVMFIGKGYNSVLDASVLKFNGERKGISDKIYYSQNSKLKYCSVHDYTLRNSDSGKPRKLDCSRHYGPIANERYGKKLLIDPPWL